MSSGPIGRESMTERAGGASNRHRPSEVDRDQGAPGDASADAATSGRRAFLALAVAVIAMAAFAFGLRTAVVKLPPERAATRDSARDTTARRQFTPPAQNPSDEFPRLR